jgi:hypothetical protein
LHGYIKQGNLVVRAYLPYLKPKRSNRDLLSELYRYRRVLLRAAGIGQISTGSQ